MLLLLLLVWCGMSLQESESKKIQQHFSRRSAYLSILCSWCGGLALWGGVAGLLGGGVGGRRHLAGDGDVDGDDAVAVAVTMVLLEEF